MNKLPLKPACENLKFLRQNIAKKNSNEITSAIFIFLQSEPFSLREAKTAQTQNYVAFDFAFKNASACNEPKTKKPITPS